MPDIQRPRLTIQEVGRYLNSRGIVTTPITTTRTQNIIAFSYQGSNYWVSETADELRIAKSIDSIDSVIYHTQSIDSFLGI